MKEIKIASAFKDPAPFFATLSPVGDEGSPFAMIMPYTCLFHIHGTYNLSDETTTEKILNISAWGQTAASDAFGDPTLYGSVRILQDGMTLFNEKFEKDEGNEEKVKRRELHEEYSVGSVSFKLQKGQKYTITVHLGVSLNDAAGNHPTTKNSIDTKINLTTK